MINIEDYTSELEAYLIDNDIYYEYEKILNNENKNIYIYVCDPNIYIMLGAPKNKLICYIWNNSLADRWEKEGFDMDEIEEECPAWVQVKGIADLIKVIKFRNKID